MSAERGNRRLGRGLDALLGERNPPAQNSDSRGRESDPSPRASRTGNGGELEREELAGAGAVQNTLVEVPVRDIRPNPFQPRRDFAEGELGELSDSIRAAGLLQPITVRRAGAGPVGGPAGYELVAGERRLRAVKELGWVTIPAVVRDYDDQASLVLALVENLQREDLNPIEEATGYARLADEFGLTQTELAEAVGKDRSTVANLLRVLQLPREVRQMLESGAITLGHARPLLALQDDDLATALARETVEQGLSVRAVEERVRRETPVPEHRKRGRPRKEDRRSPEVKLVEDALRQRLQTDVSVLARKADSGELRIRFYSSDDLNRILDLMGATD